MIAFVTLLLGLVSGVLSVTVIVDESVAIVEFDLDGRAVGRVQGAPWSLSVDFGKEFEPHELVARALDRKGQEIARARQWINLPRPMAEVEILPERNASGKITGARLTWASLLGPRPTKTTVLFDGRPLLLREQRVGLPDYDAQSTHVLSAELEFPLNLRSRTDVVLGGGSSSEAKSELTAVPILLRKGGSPLTVERFQGSFRKKGEPLRVAAIEHGPADVLLVRDLATQEAARQFGARAELDDWRRDLRLAKQDRARIVWPVARRYGSPAVAELFDLSQDFAGRDVGFHFLLTRVYYPTNENPPLRFADAVAVAGLQAFGGYSRRAVVLVLGSAMRDQSRSTPEAVRRYLERIRVPLCVWSLSKSEQEAASCALWGPAEDISSFSKLRQAVSRLKENLEAQYVVWLEGRHLPQDIALSEKAEGIQLLR